MTAEEATVRQGIDSDRYALIGAGQLGAMALAMWPNSVARPDFVLDSVRRGYLNDVPIQDLATHEPMRDIVYLLSAFKLPVSDVKAIFEQLAQPDVLTVYDLFEQAMPQTFGNGWRNLSPSPETLLRLEHLPDCFADAQSVETLQAVINWRYRRSLDDAMPMEPEAIKYDLARFDRAGMHYNCVFDCGSYDLGFRRCLEDAEITFDTYVALEADPTRFNACKKQASNLPREIQGRLVLRNEAVSDNVGSHLFLASGLLSARLVTAADIDGEDIITVPTTTLDVLAAQYLMGSGKRCLIKLHVEGAELPALHGAIAVLGAMRADLLINLSHNEQQFIDVPPFLAQHDAFDIYLRSHSLFGEGLTLFARNRQ